MKHAKSITAILVIGALLGASMAFGKTLTIASGFAGQLMSAAGEPQPGIRLERKWHWGWKDENGIQTAVSAEDGTFRFDAVTKSSITASIFPHEPSMTQEITAKLSDGDKRIWFSGKLNYDADSELGRPMDMICYTDREPVASASSSGTCVERTTD